MSKKFDNDDGVWRTIGGRRVFIRNGQDLASAMKESGKFKTAKKSEDKKDHTFNMSEEDKEKYEKVGKKIDDLTKEIEQQKNQKENQYGYSKEEWDKFQKTPMTDYERENFHNENDLKKYQDIKKDTLEYYTEDFGWEGKKPEEAFIEQMEAVKDYKTKTPYEMGKRLAEGGNYLVANSDMEKFLEERGINPNRKGDVFDTYTDYMGQVQAEMYNEFKGIKNNPYATNNRGGEDDNTSAFAQKAIDHWNSENEKYKEKYGKDDELAKNFAERWEREKKNREYGEQQKAKESQQFEVSDLKKKAMETLPKEDIDTHEGDLYIKKTKESTELLNNMKNKDSGLLTTFKDQETGETWYDVPFANMSDDFKEKTSEKNNIVNDDDKSLTYSFRVGDRNIFVVRYDRVGDNKTMDFATSSSELNKRRTDITRGGQAQKDLLPKGSKAREFYEKWDKKHLKSLTQKEYNELNNDIEELKKEYPNINSDKFSEQVELDRNSKRKPKTTNETMNEAIREKATAKLSNGKYVKDGDSINYKGKLQYQDRDGKIKNETKLYENVKVDNDGNVYYGDTKLDKDRIIGVDDRVTEQNRKRKEEMDNLLGKSTNQTMNNTIRNAYEEYKKKHPNSKMTFDKLKNK